ncbi:exocyst complex component EXO70B1-like [Telopea speciosissima]|uniref:exocyst complex component EXO70B1-like n=1 Tax=Telopea speciosissima TaxID=54955 RepID=UPI001CC5C770|nr:exocyst complex component EXO70B1-like [Telopea speciosissima]
MAENGEEKLMAVARHIAKSLGHNENMADEILQMFSTFDGRFSREKLSDNIQGDDPRSYAALDHTVKSLHRRISRYVAADHPHQPIWSDSADAAVFLDAVDELLSTIRDWDSLAYEKSVPAFLDRLDDLLQQAMFRLEDEFRLLIQRSAEAFELGRLSDNSETTGTGNFSFGSDDDDDEDGYGDVNGEGEDRIPVAHPVSDYDVLIDALPSGTINDLHEIAKRMVAAGFGKECSHVYSSCRRDFLEESISRLALQKLSIEEVQKMEWSELEDEIERWVKAANVVLRILLPSERRLCDRVFFGLSSAADLSFMEVCRGCTIQLLNFADAVAIGSRSPERLFKIVDVFDTLRDLMPEFDAMFSDQYCLFLRTEAAMIWKRLGEAIRGIFMELENLIRRDPAKTAVPGGGLHPITRYVMNYLRAACASRQTLEQAFEENFPYAGDYRNFDNIDQSTSSTLSVQMAWIMELLESNLEAKSKIYPDPALGSVFLMNNGRYIVQKVKDSELGSLLGEDWIRKHTGKVRQYQVNYQKNSWSKVLGVLKMDTGSHSKLKVFNSQFEEMCKTQSTWVVADEQLRTELRNFVAENLLPAYQNFLASLQNPPGVKRHKENYMRLSSEDIEAWINKLFHGGGGSSGGRN